MSFSVRRASVEICTSEKKVFSSIPVTMTSLGKIIFAAVPLFLALYREKDRAADEDAFLNTPEQLKSIIEEHDFIVGKFHYIMLSRYFQYIILRFYLWGTLSPDTNFVGHI